MDLDLIKSKLGALQPEKKEKYEKVDYTTLYWKPREEGKFVIRFVPSKFNAQYPFQEVFLPQLEISLVRLTLPLSDHPCQPT